MDTESNASPPEAPEVATPTPGPWAVHEHRHAGGEFWCSIGQESGRGPITDIVGAEGNKPRFFQPVAAMQYLVTPVAEQRANARLIAAAPEMYEALKRALPYLRDHVAMTAGDDFSGFGDRLAFDAAEAAIAKAEGR